MSSDTKYKKFNNSNKINVDGIHALKESDHLQCMTLIESFGDLIPCRKKSINGYTKCLYHSCASKNHNIATIIKNPEEIYLCSCDKLICNLCFHIHNKKSASHKINY
jgi:hypothetical protein